MTSLLSLESKDLASRVKDDPQKIDPNVYGANRSKGCEGLGKIMITCWLMGFIAIGPRTKWWFSTMVELFVAFLVLMAGSSQCLCTFFTTDVGVITVED